jgi:hypothetical protein
MSGETNSNCVGFVYYHFGITETEQFVRPGSIQETIEPWFSQVEVDQANALAIIIVGNQGYSQVIHMGLLIGEIPPIIIHRRGVNEPIIRESLDIGLELYQESLSKNRDRYSLWYLKSNNPLNHPLPPFLESTYSKMPSALRAIYRKTFFTSHPDPA